MQHQRSWSSVNDLSTPPKKLRQWHQMVAAGDSLAWRLRVPLTIIGLLILYFCRVFLVSRLDQFALAESLSEGISKIRTKCAAALRGGTGGCSPQIERVLTYCAERINGGEEGMLKPGDSANELVLHYVALTIRHGDRSAIHSMPGSLSYFDPDNAEASSSNKKRKKSGGKPHPLYGLDFLDSRALDYIPHLSSFEVRPLQGSTASSASDSSASVAETVKHNLKRSLDPSSIFKVPDTQLEPGMLTTRGFMQHVVLGKSLAKSYEVLLKGVHSPRNLYIRSTNYARTVQSVAALVLGLAPEIGGAARTTHPALGVLTSGPDALSPGDGESKVVIESHVDEEAEVMHGIGLKLSSHTVDASGEKALTGSCDKAVSLAKAQKSAFSIAPSVQSSLEALFTPRHLKNAAGGEEGEAGGGGVRGRFVTDLADASVPHLCHNEELPCSSDGAGCMSEQLLGQLMVQADAAFCQRYTGTHGGAEATRLSIYPFLSEVLSNLKSQSAAFVPSSSKGAKGAKDAKGKRMPPPTEAELKEGQRVKLSIFSGHDTVIAPVLAGLGAYTGKACVWPPYASRIAFELWRPKALPSNPADVAWYVRVVFNGKDISSVIPACVAERAAQKNRSTLKTKMCSLAAISAQVESLLRPASTLREACAL